MHIDVRLCEHAAERVVSDDVRGDDRGSLTVAVDRGEWFGLGRNRLKISDVDNP
jgi:hypothetical protein